jgi:hypothetical protein
MRIMGCMRKPVKSLRRKTRFTMFFSTEERLALEMLAGERGLCATDVLRQLVREAAKGLNRDAPVK